MGKIVLQEQVTLPKGYIVRDSDGNSYGVEDLLGRGGFSAVYRVRERGNGQRVFALKEIVDPDKRERERFIFEWEVLKKLDHPALPQVYRVFEHRKLRRIYILMRYVNGPDMEILRAEQPDKRFSLSLLLTLLDPIVAAVSYLHHQDAPIVHRDIKPANIIVPMGGDEAVLVDFSIAKEYIPDSTTTANRHGSPGYAAPEQYATGTTPRTDLYGLGATLYTLLTGVVPVDALTRLTSAKVDPLTPVNALVRDIPVGVSDAIQRAMSLHSEERFESVEQFWQEIHAYANEKQAVPAEIASLGTAHPERIRVRAPEEITTESFYENHAIPVVRSRRIPLLLLTFLLIVALIAGVLYYVLDYHRSAAFLSNATSIANHTVVATHTSATPSSSVTSPYPPLASAYNGTISDMPANSKTDLRLSNIQQEKGKISGYFQGLGMAGPFEGTVDTAEHIHFTITVYTGDALLVFDGVIKIGGVMAGDFNVENTNGQRTGEYGLWTAAPAE